MASDVPAVASSVRILERLAAEWPNAVAPRDLINELGLNRSTCCNILATLQRLAYSTSLQQFDMAQSGVAAPVFDRRGHVARVVCSLAFFTELHQDNVGRIGALVAGCADRITARTGGRKPVDADEG